MTKYEELVERCINAQQFLSSPGYDPSDDNMRAVLAEVFRTLEAVTDDMRAAALDLPAHIDGEDDYYLAMLRASALAVPVLEQKP